MILLESHSICKGGYMGYSDLIDKLIDTRIDEGMMTSIKKNTVNKEMKSFTDALLSHNVKKLRKVDVKVEIPMLYNHTGLTKNVGKYLVFTDSRPRDIYDEEVNGYNVDGEFYYSITFFYGSAVSRPLGKTLLYKCDSEEVFKAFGDIIKKHGFTSTSDIPNTMFKRGSVYYNVKTDEFIDDKDKVVDIIFSYCSDILVKDLVKSGNGDAKSVLNKFNVLHSGHFSVITAESSIATSINLLLYADREILQEFYDDVCAKLPKTNYKVGLSSYGFIQFVIPF